MKHSYIATDTEARNLANGRQTAIVSKVWPQPDFSDDLGFHPADIVPRLDPDFGWCIRAANGFIKLPYPTGGEVYVRETWCKVDKIDYDYKADGWGHTDWTHEEWASLPWRSAATMPREAARTWIEPTGCVVVRVQDVPTIQDEPNGLRNALGYTLDWYVGNDKDVAATAYQNSMIYKFGQQFWNDNGWVFITNVKLK